MQRTRDYQGGMSVFSRFPLGIRQGLVWITQQVYAQRVEEKKQAVENFRTVKIPKSCKNCGAEFDIETFPKVNGGWMPVCRSCKREREMKQYYKNKELNGGKTHLSMPKVENKITQYKVVCRGSGMDKKIVTIKARSEAEARAQALEIGLVPIEVK